MNLRKQIYPMFGIMCLLLIASPAFAQKADTIVPKKGSNVRGRITKATPQSITVDVKGKSKKIPVTEIDHINFGEESPYMKQARESIEEGQFDQAAGRLERVDTAKLKTDLVKSEYSYLLARLKIEQSKKGELETSTAAKATIDFLKKNNKSYHYYELLESLGRMAMQMGSPDRAAKYFGQLAKSPAAETKALASVLAGDALRAQGKSKFPNAIKRYDAVLGLNSGNPEMARLKGLALVGKSACQAAAGKAADAIPALEKLIADTDSSDIELHAAANNALGDCHLSAGSNMDAALAWLHTDQLFFRDSAAHAEALYKLTQVFGELGQPAQAAQKRQLLKTRYTNSIWAKRP